MDYFETYAPVVMWTTVRLMLILECLLDLKSKQGDVNCAFLHAHLSEEETVYVHMPQGFTQYDKRGKAKVLKLKRCLYGLEHTPTVCLTPRKYLTSAQFSYYKMLRIKHITRVSHNKFNFLWTDSCQKKKFGHWRVVEMCGVKPPC